MIKRGRPRVMLTEDEKKMIEEYFSNNLNLQQMADKVGITKASLRYKIEKYHREQQEKDLTS